MRALKALGAVALIITVGACDNTTSRDIEFSKLNNFFVRNDVVLTSFENQFVINDKNEFDKMFGMARTMGNTITPVDFSKYFVAAIIMDETGRETELNIQSVQEQNNDLYIKYTIERGPERSYTSIPFDAVKIERGNYKSIMFYEVNTLKKTISLTDN